jgi:hypothetical protein
MFAIHPNPEPFIFQVIAAIFKPLILKCSRDTSEKDRRSRLLNLPFALVPHLARGASPSSTTPARAGGTAVVSRAALLLRLPRLRSYNDLGIRSYLDKVLSARWRGREGRDYYVSGRCGREMQCERVHMSSSWIGESSDLGEEVHLEER